MTFLEFLGKNKKKKEKEKYTRQQTNSIRPNTLRRTDNNNESEREKKSPSK